jgi:hypothetical protein
MNDGDGEWRMVVGKDDGRMVAMANGECERQVDGER